MQAGVKPLIIFSHGNSFPASTYKVLFGHLEKLGYNVRAIEKFGHDPAYPVTSNWPHLIRQLADFAAKEVAATGQAPLFVGHSLGGFLSLMCAALHPNPGGMPVQGVVLLDSPVISGWKAAAVRIAKATRLVGSVPPGAVSRKRKNEWAGKDDVLAHFGRKKTFAIWEAQVLRDYVEHGTHDAVTPGHSVRLLSFDREVETAIYNTLPHNLDKLLKQHPLQCPVAFVGGRQSVEIRQVGLAMTKRVTKGRLTMLDGTHLFPMEKPQETSEAVHAAIADFSKPG
jgi:pimeloyl-ACP methyl ester carboxylesterase